MKNKSGSQVQRAGNWLHCPVCGKDRFYQREGILNTRGISLIDLDWMNPRADCYICENFLHIVWFFGRDKKL